MKLIIIVITLMLCTETAFAAEAKKGELFWGSLQGKVQKLSSSRKIAASATVAGVKGAKNDRADIYWKGKDKKIEIGEEELQKFNLALEYRSNGEKDKALKSFDSFLKEHPNSPLHAEGTQAMQLLNAELNQQPAVTPAQPAVTPAQPAVTPAQPVAVKASPAPGTPVPAGTSGSAPATADAKPSQPLPNKQP